MGSISSLDTTDLSNVEKRSAPGHVPGHDGVNGFAPFEVDCATLTEQLSETGLKEEVLLLAWLIVLLRTREGMQILFEWARNDRPSISGQTAETQQFSMNNVITNLETTIGQAADAIRRELKYGDAKKINADATPKAMMLSSGRLSRTSDEIDDEGVLHIEVHLERDKLEVHPVWYTDNSLPYTIRHQVETFVETIRQCVSRPNASVQDMLGPTTRDMNDIWSWNHKLPPTYNFCMHDMVAERARQHPDKVGIASWDGDLTYGQIDDYSTRIGHSLRELGVQLHDFVPICFEKSKWTIVAVLAAMKAGATFVLMDPSLPLARLQNMATQVNAKTMITSRQQRDFGSSILQNGNFIVVDTATFEPAVDTTSLAPLPTVPATTLMYLIFTSGSTGTPKGVKISHQTYTSSAIPRARAVGYNSESRVLDFASYAFDVSIDSMLLTLGDGGCLCIPSDENRMNDINRVIRDMRINYAGITPSVARILEPDVIQSLDILGLGGEAASARDVNEWGKDTRIVIGYGPCECTIGCTINSDTATGRNYISIGHGNGANIWIVDPNDHEILMPVGAIGEILIEGPIVGQGYLGDPEKTAAAFIKNPKWLLDGHDGYKGRRGRLYKSGDLGRYDPDGSGDIVFAGRKDTQVKLRGQRVELGEIESQLKARLPTETHVVVEVIIPQGERAQPTLVSFIAAETTRTHAVKELTSDHLPNELRDILNGMNADLSKVLPRYMIPTGYVPVNHIPILISGKVDRKRLKAYGATVDLRDLENDTASSTPTRDLSELETRLQRAWSEVLKVPTKVIRLEDNFFALGGDSLAAMRLVTACRKLRLEIGVAQIFNNPSLIAMAEVVKQVNDQEGGQIEPFSMISLPADEARFEAATACGVDPSTIEDVYPCTASQESLFTLSLRSDEAYIAQRVASIPSNIDIHTWKTAWDKVILALPILRTRVAQIPVPGLQQVVLKESITWRFATDLQEYLSSDRNETVELGKSLARYAIIDDAGRGQRYMVWTVHHVLYDGWSEPLILQEVSKALREQDVEIQAYMKDYVKYMQDTDAEQMREYWRKELDGANGPQFPRLPSRDYMPTPNGTVEKTMSLPSLSGSPSTIATLIRAAWALVASQYTNSDDVVFGETLTGRDIAVPGVESIVGPLIATVPVRVQIRRNTTVETYLQSVQQTMLSRTPYLHMGWQNIRKVSADAQFASEAGTGLVIQPDPEYVGSELGFEQGDVLKEALHFNPYPLMVALGIKNDELRACASFDTGLIAPAKMERVLEQLGATCHRLVHDLTATIADISCLSDAELDTIWARNQVAPMSLDRSSSSLRADGTTKYGSSYPPAVVAWVCDARIPSILAPTGTVGELWLEGNCLPGDSRSSPPWLVAGSSNYHGREGRVQATGDLVELQDDGCIIFVGRKESSLAISGHAVDPTELQAHLMRQLPQHTRTAVTTAVLPGAASNDDARLIAFIEQESNTDTTVQVLSQPQYIEQAGVEVVSGISKELAVGLRKFDRFAHDTLPSYMIPSAYFIINRIPQRSGQTDHAALLDFISSIAPELLDTIHRELNKVLAETSSSTEVTSNEAILRSAWSKLLRVPLKDIDTEDNFFRLGGDSVLAMKLAASLRGQGYSLTVADIFRHMRLCDAAAVMKATEVKQHTRPTYRPFSALQVSDSKAFVRSNVQPKLADQSWTVKDVCPVTDSQMLDIKATVNAPRTSYQYTMLYMNRTIDADRLLRSCNQLVEMHDILRTVFVQHESSFLQVVLEKISVRVQLKKTTEEDIEKYVKDICTLRAESSFELGTPFAQFIHVEGPNGQHTLVIGLSHAQYDGVSLPNLLRDLESLYAGKNVEKSEAYPHYIARTLNNDIQESAIKYWTGLLKDSAMSTIVGSATLPMDKAIFQHRSVDIIQKPQEITTANLLTAAWAIVLARRLQKTDVTFGSITSGRNIDSTFLEDVQGPCYQFTPVRVPFKEGWEAIDLLRFVQKQAAESAPHDFLGFSKIAQECTSWAKETTFFDSIVHHQDWDDFDTMPFDGSEIKVDILNPHGDAAHPLKVVSFVQGGETRVGIVGSERDPVFIDKVLDELAVCVEELALGHSVSISACPSPTQSLMEFE